MKNIPIAVCCLLLMPPFFLSCDNGRDKAIDNAIRAKQAAKGNSVSTFEVMKETGNDGLITVFYHAACKSPNNKSGVSK